MDVRLRAFAEALESLSYLVNVDLPVLSDTLDPRLIDGIRNGQAKKFEYTLELCWKAIKEYLKQNEGIDEASPKKVVKAFYLSGYMPEDDYLTLIQAIDDRNKLSHIYEQREFDLIVARLHQHAALLQRVLETLKRPAS
jgi:nucleotidyltransferase substrate binding protein (TIGR01987 family)